MSAAGVEYLAEASRELDGALDWYLERSLTAAEAFLTEIDHGIQLIRGTPQMWPQFEGNTRRYVLRKFPYSIIFRQVDDLIQVVAVAHQKRRPGYWSNR
ncbi:MAG TPA: type II toxin-antitoxin system RelE/ParE family toxin [Acidobacteriota bacterium]|nr:type II toxin-antitoxin system RelE/ParE family toxin [Acidobacteriota bacterium]